MYGRISEGIRAQTEFRSVVQNLAFIDKEYSSVFAMILIYLIVALLYASGEAVTPLSSSAVSQSTRVPRVLYHPTGCIFDLVAVNGEGSFSDSMPSGRVLTCNACMNAFDSSIYLYFPFVRPLCMPPTIAAEYQLITAAFNNISIVGRLVYDFYRNPKSGVFMHVYV